MAFSSTLPRHQYLPVLSDVLDALDLSGFHAALSYVMTRKKIWRSSVSPYPLFREVVQQLHS